MAIDSAIQQNFDDRQRQHRLNSVADKAKVNALDLKPATLKIVELEEEEQVSFRDNSGSSAVKRS